MIVFKILRSLHSLRMTEKENVILSEAKNLNDKKKNPSYLQIIHNSVTV